MYIVWNTTANAPEGLPLVVPPADSTDNWLPLILPEPRVTTLQCIEYSLVDGSVVGTWIGEGDPLDAMATVDEIAERHRELETQPVMAFGVSLDANERSEKRIEDAIRAFDYLPLDPGLVEEVNGVKVIYWKDANNDSNPLDKATLTALLDEMIKQRAIRGSALFKQLQILKANGCTLRQLKEWTA